MRRLLAALWLLPLVAVAETAAYFEPQAFLAGHCWKGTFPDGKKTDEHCFEWIYGGKFLRDRHVVGDGSYAGETLYWWDAEARAVHYMYFSSNGGVSRGSVASEDGALLFPEERFVAEGIEQVYRSRWQRDGDDAYEVVAEIRTADGWKVAWQMRMQRQTPRASP